MPERSLRIAMVAPPWFEVPPQGYGGIEAMCGDLVDGLVARGHEVILCSAGRSNTQATRKLSTYQDPPSPRVGEILPEVLHAATVRRELGQLDLDVIHDHTVLGPLLAPMHPAPTVVTVHGPLEPETASYYRTCNDNVGFVAISHSQRSAAADLPWLRTVHNAVPVQRFPFQRDKEDFALCLGRCSPEKGLDVAMDVAKRANIRLLVAAKCNEEPEQAYFDAHLKPRLDSNIDWLGEVAGDEKLDLLRRARCLLFPIRWEEPFGMVMIEALACGTPVVATRMGSVPEVIRQGVTGLIADDEDDLVELLHQVDHIDPDACRADAEARFDVSRMAARYEQVYRGLLAGHGRPSSQPIIQPVDGAPQLPTAS